MRPIRDRDAGAGIAFPSLVDDRPGDGVFRVDRRVYLDREVFDAELVRIFESSWVFLCHESLIPRAGDYFATHIGRQPVFAIRREDGGVGCFVNACSHRGALLTRQRTGNARRLVCPFHAWTYDTEGRCVAIKDQRRGWPQAGFDRRAFDLRPAPRVASYRGFVFASLAAEAPDLADHLAGAKPFIDLYADMSPEGLETVRGSVTYVAACNWKLAHENGIDAYHVSTVHRNFHDTILRRQERPGYDGPRRTDYARLKDELPSGNYDLGNGHVAIWADRADPSAQPLYESRDRLRREFGERRVEWMLNRSRNLIVFPNMLLNDLAGSHLRTYRPLAPDKTEVTVWCIAPKGESRAARTARIRKFEDFFMPTGMATPDDLAALVSAQAGSEGLASRWNDFSRGIATAIEGPDETAATLGLRPATSNDASWTQETVFHGVWREWLRRMTAGTAT